MTTPVPEDFEFEFIAPVSKILSALNKLQDNEQKPNCITDLGPDLTEVILSSASKISRTITYELFNLMDSKDTGMKEPNYIDLIKNITDMLSVKKTDSTANTVDTGAPQNSTVDTGLESQCRGRAEPDKDGRSQSALVHPCTNVDGQAKMFNMVIGSSTQSQPQPSAIDLAPNIGPHIEPPEYASLDPTTKTVKLDKPFARDIQAMFRSKYMEFSNLKLPADNKGFQIKTHNELYNAIERAFDISIRTLNKYAIQEHPSITELIQEHNPKIRLPASSMNELTKYLSNYSCTYNPDEKMKITPSQFKQVKFLLIDWLKAHPDMYIIV